MSHYNHLIGGLLFKDNRLSYREQLNELQLPEPYATLKDVACNFDTDITVDELFEVAKDNISDLTIKKDITQVTPAVFRYCLNELRALHSLNTVLDIAVEDTLDNYGKLREINTLTDNFRSSVGSKAKKSNTLVASMTPVYHTFCRYELSLGDACIVAAYPGVGKTRTLLSLGKEIKTKYPKDDILYISIADWTEGRLKNLLDTANYPEIYASCYDVAGMDNVKADVELVKPQVLLLDYLGVMDFPSVLGNAASPRHGMKWLSDECKKLAVRHNMLVISAYQLRTLSDQPVPDDLFESKTGLLSAPDLVVALGCRPNQLQTPKRNLVCFKARHQSLLPVQSVHLDAINLEVTP